MNHIYDAVVVGAGPGGSSAAHFLAERGMDVLLLDKADFPRDKTCGDGLTPRALRILDEMGILGEAKLAGFQINGLELHSRAGDVFQSPIPDHPDNPDHMLIVPRLKLDDLLRRRAIKSGARFEGNVRMRTLEHQPGHVLVHAHKDGAQYSYKTRVVILAIGANIRILHELGILRYTPQIILAARAYFEGISSLSDFVQIHFSNVPIPGYGWIFPESRNSANVGVGYWPNNLSWSKRPNSPRSAMAEYLNAPKVKSILQAAKQVESLKSYPIRIDFTTAPSYAKRILLVGETVGLVSPLTGEGIDFALQSGKIAADFLFSLYQKNDFSLKAIAKYDQILRRKFQQLFLTLEQINKVFFNPWMLGKAIRAAIRHPEVKEFLTQSMLAIDPPKKAYSWKIISKVVIA